MFLLLISFQSVGKNTLSFFCGLGLCVGKKMKVCFVRWHKIFAGWLFLIQLFFALALEAVSVVVQVVRNGGFKSVSLMVALSP